jgi:circadian clock protein KaiC
MHLLRVHKLINELKPAAVIIDPISNYLALGDDLEVKAMLIRLIDFLKGKGITAVFTSLTHGGDAMEATVIGVSSLIDTWLLLRDIESNGERNRGLYIIKARGIAHSNQIREFLLTSRGAELLDVYIGAEGVLTGSARAAQEAREAAAATLRQQDIERRQRELERKRAALDAQIAALRAAHEIDSQELEMGLAEERLREEKLAMDRVDMARLRRVEGGNGRRKSRNNRKELQHERS